MAKSALKPTGILSRIFSQFMPLPLSGSSPSKKCLFFNRFAVICRLISNFRTFVYFIFLAMVNAENFILSKPYCQLHFLLGLLIQEFSMALHESHAYRRLVITLVRNLLVKHSTDLRYDNAVCSKVCSVWKFLEFRLLKVALPFCMHRL